MIFVNIKLHKQCDCINISSGFSVFMRLSFFSAPGLGSYVEALVRRHDNEFNVSSLPSSHIFNQFFSKAAWTFHHSSNIRGNGGA